MEVARGEMTELRIAGRPVGPNHPCFIIAEAGSNHDGKLEQALLLVDAAAAAKADAVKFQTFRARTMYPRASGPVEYLESLGITTPIYDLIEGMEMPEGWIPRLAEHAAQRGIVFLSTAFDEETADLLEPFVPAFKVASYELTHIPLVRHIARKRRPMIISTGGATIAEAREAVAAIRAEGNEQIVVLQCTARYPAPLESIDVSALARLRSELGVLVGLSDHSREPLPAPLAAVALGACVIEKHFTLDRTLSGPDHSFAIEPGELADLVRGIRDVERALGSPEKRVRDVERELVDYRRGIFTLRPVTAGTRLTREDVAVLRRAGRPDLGLHPRDLPDVLRKRATRDLDEGRLVSREDIAD